MLVLVAGLGTLPVACIPCCAAPDALLFLLLLLLLLLHVLLRHVDLCG
jgi:hypothetical protein